MPYLRRGCSILFIVAALLIAGRLIYGLTRPSALGQVARLAQTGRTSDLAQIQAALLRELPPGTSAQDLGRFLEQADVHVDVERMLRSRNDRSTFGQGSRLVSCSPTDFAYGITCHVYDDPDRLTFPCRDIVVIAFDFGRYDTLQGIRVKNDGACL